MAQSQKPRKTKDLHHSRSVVKKTFRLCKGTARLSRIPLLPLHNLFLETLMWSNSRPSSSRLTAKGLSRSVFSKQQPSTAHFLCPAFRTLEARCIRPYPQEMHSKTSVVPQKLPQPLPQKFISGAVVHAEVLQKNYHDSDSSGFYKLKIVLATSIPHNFFIVIKSIVTVSLQRSSLQPHF